MLSAKVFNLWTWNIDLNCGIVFVCFEPFLSALCADCKPKRTSEEWWSVNEVMTLHSLHHETPIEQNASETVNGVEEEPYEKAMLNGQEWDPQCWPSWCSSAAFKMKQLLWSVSQFKQRDIGLAPIEHPTSEKAAPEIESLEWRHVCIRSSGFTWMCVIAFFQQKNDVRIDERTEYVLH